MMRATVIKRPYVYCGDVTWFQRECTGPRGAHIRWESCCVSCGEQPSKRASLAKQERATEKAVA